MPLYRRLPKRGFTNRNSLEIVAINVDVLNRFENDTEVPNRNFTGNRLQKAYGKNFKISGNANPVVCDYFLERGDYLKLGLQIQRNCNLRLHARDRRSLREAGKGDFLTEG